jgi:hypothetical protein
MKTKIISVLIVIAYFSISFILFTGDATSPGKNPDSILNNILGFPYLLSQGAGFYLGIAGLILTTIMVGLLLWYLVFQILKYLRRGL